VVRAGETSAVVIDPALDARLQLGDRASLVYTSARDQDALLLTDVAALGAALDATRVVAVNANGARVVEVDGLGDVDDDDRVRGRLPRASVAALAGPSLRRRVRFLVAAACAAVVSADAAAVPRFRPRSLSLSLLLAAPPFPPHGRVQHVVLAQVSVD
jgi:hypothetical protein